MEFARGRRIVIFFTLIGILYLRRDKFNSFRPISSINNKLSKYTPWKILLGGYTIHYFLSHLLCIVGLGSTDLPEQHYHPDFKKVRRVFTGLDAGIISSLHVEPKWLRDILSILLGAYYIIFTNKAEDRMHRFHQEATIDGVRACWTKGRHPLLWKITKMNEKTKIIIHRRHIIIDPIKILKIDTKNEENLRPIHVYLYFQGTEQQLKESKHLIINYPGGGFVTMNHLHHESYVQKYCNYLHIPVISVDYRKAPEHQYPAGFNDAYYTYKCIVATKGQILGMNIQKQPIKIALTGDSAGGNFVAAVCCRSIVEQIQIPDGLLMAYPVLDLNMSLFRPVNDVVDHDRNYTNAIVRYSSSHDIDKGDVYSSLNSYVEEGAIKQILKNAENALNKQQENFGAFNQHLLRNRGDESGHPLTSRVQFLNDGVLPIKYILLLGEAYVPTNGDPINDMYLSPIKAPMHILSKFPKTRIHVGSVDPLVDDSRRFTSLLKYANNRSDVKLLEWDGVSHAYLQCPSFLLPQSRFSIELSVHWLSDMLGVEVVDRKSFRYDYNKRKKSLSNKTDDFATLRSRM